jgi:hypothetical protein
MGEIDGLDTFVYLLELLRVLDVFLEEVWG